jgi:hypothetical protein
VTFPEWWDWELELTPHIEKRMEDRGFNEVELRQVLERAAGFRDDVADGRFVIEARFQGRSGRWLSSPTKWSILAGSSPRTASSHEAAIRGHSFSSSPTVSEDRLPVLSCREWTGAPSDTCATRPPSIPT